VGWSIAAAWLLFAGIEVWTGSVLVSWIFPIALIAELVALASLAWIWSRRSVPGWLQVTLLSIAAFVFLARGFLLVLGKPSYGTDEIAFDQYAAQLLLFHGQNPYVHSMAPALTQFQVPDIYHSFTVTGSEITKLSYPAGSFLSYIPALVLGLRMQAAVLVDAVAWLIGMFMTWRVLPERLKWLVVPLGTEVIYLGYAAGGVTDSLYLPFLIGAYWRWDRYGDPNERSIARWIGPVALGIACSIKQTPWFAVPFLVVGIALEASSRGRSGLRTSARYLRTTLATFLVINAPFILWSPSAWFEGVTTPLTAHFIPAGQGIVGLTMFLHFGGQLKYYTWASVFIVITMLTLFVGWYTTMKRAWPVLLPLAFFWPMRSFASYMVMTIPAIVVAVTSVRDANRPGVRLVRVACIGAAVASGLALIAAMTVPPDLSLKVLGERSTGQLQSIDHLAVQITNHSSRPIVPHFTITPGGQQTTFWYQTSGPPAIPPHATVVDALEAPNSESMPGMNGGFIVDAFVARPEQLATSPTVHPPVMSTLLTPLGIDHPIPVNDSVGMTVQLISQVGSDAPTSGVRVALSQVVYSQDGLLPGEASIDGTPEGQTPIVRKTNRFGRVVFNVVGVQPQRDPVFFQAWLLPASNVPTGYSDIVSVQFSAR
jgi:uncharacterized membrane protein